MLKTGKRISFEEGIRFLKEVPLTEIGVAADEFRRKLHSNIATFIRNMHLNVTNICKNACRFCSFRKSKNEKGAFTLTVDEALNLIESALNEGIREVHLVNALNPELRLDFYIFLINEIKKSFPGLTIKGLTAIEIDFLASLEEIKHEEVVDKLIEAGVELFPGGGAEIFSQRARKLLGTSKAPKETYLKIHEIIHSRNVKSNATMLYGHFETEEEIVDHLNALRMLQDKTGGFSAFIPLRFVAKNTSIKVKEKGAQNDLKIIAFSRLFLDNFEHIKAYWVSLTPEVAQVALGFGADDLDGTIYTERIIRSAGAEVRPGLTADEMKKLIIEAGFEPRERDSHFNIQDAS